MTKRSIRNIVLAGCLMLLVFALMSKLGLFFLTPIAGGLTAYCAALIALGEITRQDFAALVPGKRVQSVT
jgi:hypothetical protein